MNKIIIVKGLPGSGKSTWSKKIIDKYPERYKRINNDDLNSMMSNGKLSDDKGAFNRRISDALIIETLKAEKNVILDNTNLNPRIEKDIRKLAEEYHAIVKIKDFTDVPIEICIERDSKREKPVGEKVIRGMYDRYLKPKSK
jgi:predicted kinase